MRKLLLLALLCLVALPTSSIAKGAPPGQASTLIGLINDYRAQNGLAAFAQDGTLMQLAQGQSDYQASIQQVTHGGPGGTRPRDRAYAAGYGDGAVIFISELVTGGFDQSVNQALEWWQNSPEHNSYLLSDNYYEIGIGVATDGQGRYYYTAELGNIAGGTTYVPENSAGATSEPQVVMIPVLKAEPRDNGALVHIVRQGQALWTIAAVYEVSLEHLYSLNNLNEYSFIFPGDEIIIEPEGSLPTSTPTQDPEQPTATETTPPASPTASVTPVVAAATETPTELAQVSQVQSTEPPAASNNTVFWVVGLALGSIIAVFTASFFIQRPQVPQLPDDNDPFAPIE